MKNDEDGVADLNNSIGDLLARARSGDLKAFDELVGIYQDRVYALAYRLLGDYDDATDARQETFIRAWRNLKGFREGAEFSTWLHSITVNLCLTWKRKNDRRSTHEALPEDLADARARSPIADLEESETLLAVRRVLGAMPSHYRVLIVLRDMEGRSFEEIAAILGCSVASARMRLCKARNMLRERMRPYITEEDS